MNEDEATTLFQSQLFTSYAGVNRAGGFAFCMSGPNSARA